MAPGVASGTGGVEGKGLTSTRGGTEPKDGPSARVEDRIFVDADIADEAWTSEARDDTVWRLDPAITGADTIGAAADPR